MSLQLRYTEDFSEGLKRLMKEECEGTLRYLEESSTEEEKHKAVHESRKAFKKVRACLRLVRDHIDFYDRENTWFRDLGRQISEVRNATAYLEILEVLKAQYQSQLYKNSFADLEKSIHSYRDKLAKDVFKQGDQLKETHAKLEAKVDEITSWKINIQQFEDIRPSLKRTYRRGYNDLKEIIKSGKVEDFHEWRKRVKYLRYHINILNRLWPKVMETWEEELHDITNFTGMLHDLYNLGELVKELDEPFLDAEDRMLFYAILEKQQNYMKEHALLKGQKYYVAAPSDFCDRINTFWKMHRREIENSNLPRAEQLKTT